MLFPMHVGLMALAFLFICTGVFTAAFRRKTPSWLKRHQSFGVLGLAMALSGFVSIVLLISLMESEHFRSPHTWVGLAAVSLILYNPLTGRLQLSIGAQGRKLRPWHVWPGRLIIVLMALNIALGIAMFF